jgi:hypothetical protein
VTVSSPHPGELPAADPIVRVASECCAVAHKSGAAADYGAEAEADGESGAASMLVVRCEGTAVDGGYDVISGGVGRCLADNSSLGNPGALD